MAYQQPFVISTVILDPGADETYALAKVPSGMSLTVTAVQFAVQGGFTANDTNYIKLYIYDGGAAGTGTTVIGQYLGIATAGSGNITDLVPFAATVTMVQLDAGDVLIFLYDEGGTVAPTSITVTVMGFWGYPAS